MQEIVNPDQACSGVNTSTHALNATTSVHNAVSPLNAYEAKQHEAMRNV